jgi:hypothetical protein
MCSSFNVLHVSHVARVGNRPGYTRRLPGVPLWQPVCEAVWATSANRRYNREHLSSVKLVVGRCVSIVSDCPLTAAGPAFMHEGLFHASTVTQSWQPTLTSQDDQCRVSHALHTHSYQQMTKQFRRYSVEWDASLKRCMGAFRERLACDYCVPRHLVPCQALVCLHGTEALRRAVAPQQSSGHLRAACMRLHAETSTKLGDARNHQTSCQPDPLFILKLPRGQSRRHRPPSTVHTTTRVGYSFADRK